MYSNLGKALVSLGLIALTGWVFYLTGSIWSFVLLAGIEFPQENYFVARQPEDDINDK